METYTEMADQLERQAEEIVPVDARPYTSCYEALHENQDLLERARSMQAMARGIREKFAHIVSSGFGIPSECPNMRKAIVTIRKGKVSFSSEQLLRSIKLLLDDVPYIAFKSPKGLLPYVTVLFWVKEENDENCDVMKQVETMRREVAVDGLQIKFDVDAVLAPTRYVLYLYEKSSGFEFSKAGLSEKEEKQFNAILNLILDPRRRKIQQIPVKRPCRLDESTPITKKKRDDGCA